MSIVERKLIVMGAIAAVLVLANVDTIVDWLEHAGLVPFAQHIRTEYVTGTAIAVIVALLILLPSRMVWAVCARRCPVCDAALLRRCRYCAECGSRT